MSERKGIDLLRYAVKLLDSNNESLNQRFTAEQLLRIADACQKSGWDFWPDDWTERQLQECIQFGIVPKWKEETTPNGGTKYVPDYHNESEKVFQVAGTFTSSSNVKVYADTLDDAIKWVRGPMPTPLDSTYVPDSFEVDIETTENMPPIDS